MRRKLFYIIRDKSKIKTNKDSINKSKYKKDPNISYLNNEIYNQCDYVNKNKKIPILIWDLPSREKSHNYIGKQ